MPSADRPAVSFEFFPPKTDEGEQLLWEAIRRVEALKPTFVSVTYGAGGSTRDRTIRITERIAQETTLSPVGHLTCVGASVAQVRAVIAAYLAAGVGRILALRGDPSGGPGSPWVRHPEGLDHATDLVRLVRSLGAIDVGVAAFPEGHPESPSLEHDARVLAEKEQAGATFAITQLFFRVEDYVSLVDRARAHGCTLPIIPGIMPVTDVAQLARFAALSGATFPQDLARRFQDAADEHAVREIGVEVAVEMCRGLLDAGAPSLHFYTLNRSTASLEVCRRLGF